MCPLRTNAGAPVIASSIRCTLGRNARRRARRRRAASDAAARARSKRWARSASSSWSARASASRTLSETPLSVAALEPRVVVDADAGEERNLLSTETRNAPVVAVDAQPRLLRRDPGPPRSSGTPGSRSWCPRAEGNAAPRTLGGPAGTWINRVGHRGRAPCFSEGHESNCHVRRRRRPGRERPRRPPRRADGCARPRDPLLHLRQ